MPRRTPFMTFLVLPEGRQLTFILMVGVFFLLFVAAVLVAVLRRRQRNQVITAEWRAARDIAGRRGVSGKDWDLLRKVIERHSPREPLSAVTVQQCFDACVEAELARLETLGDAAQDESLGALLRALRTQFGLDYVPYGRPVHSTRELSTGQPVWIAPAADPSAEWFRTRVVSIDEAHFSITSWSGAQTGMPKVRPSDVVRGHMWRDDDARYGFATALVRFDETPPIWVLHHSADLKRTQSREYYRIHVDLPTRAALLDAQTPIDTQQLGLHPAGTHFDGTITSLSAGGLALVTKDAAPVQSVLRIALKLPGEEPVKVHVRVVGVSPVSRQTYKVRGSFLDVDEETRDGIARYISYRQQMMLAAEAGIDMQPEQ